MASACAKCLGIAGEKDLGVIIRTSMVDVAAAVVKYLRSGCGLGGQVLEMCGRGLER